MKPKYSSFHNLKVDQFNCFFSQICQVSHAQLQSREITQAQVNNCFVTHQAQQIFIMTKGGTKFNLPMDQQVSRIFPLVEGLLIQFFVKPEIKLQQVLFYQKNKFKMQIQEPISMFSSGKKSQGKYCYATLTRHPFNPLKILGELSNQLINPWYKTFEQVVAVSQTLPLIVTYNQELRRNAFHVILANMNQVKKQYQLSFTPTHSYSLKTILENPHYEILSMLLYEENVSNQKIIDVKLNKSTKKGCISLYALTELKTVKVYEINFYGTPHTSTKLMKTIPNVKSLSDVTLFSQNTFIPRPLKNSHEPQLLFEILHDQISKLKDCVVILGQDQIAYFYLHGEAIHRVKKEVMSSALINELIKDPFDSLVLKTVEQCLDDRFAFIRILSKYCSGQSLSKALLQIFQFKIQIFSILHLLYQELKLYELMRYQRQKLGQIMIELSQKRNKKQYLDYYGRQGFASNKQQLGSKIQSLQVDQVYDIFDLLDKILFKKTFMKSPVFCIFNRSKFIINFFQILVNGKQQISIEALSKEYSVSNIYHGNQYLYKSKYPLLSQKVFHLDYYNKVYSNLSLTGAKPQCKEQAAFIHLIKHNQNHDSIITYPLAIRAVFNWLLRQMRRNLPFTMYEDIPQLGFNLIRRQDLYKNIQLYQKKVLNVPYHLKKPSLDDHIKTLIHTSTSQQYFLTSNASQMNKFNNDLVFQQVDRLLSSTSQIKIKIKDIETIPEQKWEVQSQNILMKFANRKLAVIVGQGAFNLATSTSFITDIIKIQKINLSGVMPNDIKISLDLKEDKEAIVHWPEFHSGMVAGLKLSRHVIPLSQDHLKTWIFYQKPDTPKRDHSGFLLSLGLLGYLKCFSPTDIYQYLKPNNEFTSVAILLGVAASNISNSSQSITKALILHIPVLLPPTIDVQIPINVQTSALIGLGLLHKGTCNRAMTQTALSQIGKRPTSDKCLDREGYSLAAGWALGMICLGMKDKKQSFRDLQLQERLIRFIEGGKKMDIPQSMISTNYINESKCSSIKEGPNVNLHVTAPSALLAISLMYLKSNDRQIYQKITIPNSFNTIQECNPNHILLKTIAKNLIMWDEIDCTKQFVQGQVPQLIQFIYQNTLNKVYERYYLVYNVSEIDYQTITSIFANVTTGAIVAMSLKYAGTGNTTVVQTIKQHIQHLKSMKIIKCQFANDPMNKNCIDQYELFSLLSVSLLGLSIVMAGSCDIQCLKIIRIVRKKFQDSKVFHYGFSLAVNMAIGFIFLGYGNYTFNRQNLSIAALLITIYPQFPNTPSDNKWHLQALRHFYVLAMEEKIFHAVDVDTNKVVNVNAQMDFQIQNNKIISQTVQTPVLLQENKKLLHVKIRDPDYFDVDFAFAKSKTQPKAIYIKRKYFKDINPKMLNPQNPLCTQTLQRSIKQSLSSQVRFTSLFPQKGKTSSTSGKKPNLSYLLKKSNPQNMTKISQKFSNSLISDQLYYQLLKQDKLQMLEIYMNLKEQLRQVLNDNSKDSLIVSNIPFLLNFQRIYGINQFSNIVSNQIQGLKKKLLESQQNKQMFKTYILEPFTGSIKNAEVLKLLRLFRTPQIKELSTSLQALKKLKDFSSQDTIKMLFYIANPECQMQVLNLISKVYAESIKKN